MQYDDWKLNNPDDDLNHDFGTCKFCNKDLKNDYHDEFCSASCKKHFNKELERTCEICGCNYTPTDNTETFNVCEENENCWLVYESKIENYLRNKLDEVESMHSFDLATDTLRCWIDEYNEQLRQYNVSGRSEQLVCDCTHTQACKTCAKSKDIDWDDVWDEAN